MKRVIVISTVLLTLGIGMISAGALNKDRNKKQYGEGTKEKGVQKKYQTNNLEKKKEVLDKKVEDGTLTKEEATEIYETIKKNMEKCDGSGKNKGAFKGLGLRLGHERGKRVK